MRKFRKIVWKIWRVWLVVSIPINIISLFFMACCLDSDIIWPGIIGLINVSWLLVLIIANDPYRLDKEKRERRKENETRDKENHIA